MTPGEAILGPKQCKPASSDWKVGLLLVSAVWGWKAQSHQIPPSVTISILKALFSTF